MKTKLHFSRCIVLMIVLLSTLGALAQTSQTLTQNVCPGTEPYLVTPGNIGDSFQWSISTGTSGVNWTISTPTLSSTNVVWANPAAPVTYRLSLTETNGSSCTTVVSVDVTVYPLPTNYTVTGEGSYCAGGTGLPVGLSGSQAGVNYQLQIGGINTGALVPGTGSALNFGNKTAAGTYTVVASTTAVQSCSVNMTGNAVIIIDPLPTVFNVTGGGSYCIGGTGVAVGLSGSQVGVNYQLKLDNVNSGASVPGTGAVLNFGNKTVAGTYTVIATYASATACTINMTGNAIVTINPLPTPTITGPIEAITLSNKVYTTQAGMSGYTWTVSAGSTITSGAGTNAITVKWNTAGNQTVSVNYTNANSCTAANPTIKNVTVGDNPTIDGPTPVCVTSTNSVYTTEAGMTGYVWTVSAGGTITAGAGTDAITVTWNTVGAQTLTVNYTNGVGYTAPSPTSYSVTVESLPIPTITGSTPVCIGTVGSVYTTEAEMTAYTWVVSAGGTITSGGTVTDNTVTITWNTAGPQTVSVNYTNATGCMAAAPTVKPVTVNPLPTTSPIWHN